VKSVAKDKPSGKSRANPRGIKPNKAQSNSDVLEGLSRFSFKFYDPNHAVFHCKDRQPEYFHSLLVRMKTLSLMRASELTHAKPTSATRFHRIDWDRDNVSVKSFGIKGRDEYDEEAWQFSISANEHGRVHGFLIANVFYVVWLDPEHKLYPGKA
jgi:hypothetical protein